MIVRYFRIRHVVAIALFGLVVLFVLAAMGVISLSPWSTKPKITFLSDDYSEADIPDGFFSVRAGKLPTFSVIEDVQLRKALFFSYLHPMVTRENMRLARHRVNILALKDRSELTSKEEQYLLQLAEQFNIPTEGVWQETYFERLLNRVDVVPISLALAQAANESAWGTSRFARQANNLFGLWCFKKGCGLVPAIREKGKSHEVAKFYSADASVRAYIHNLNSHEAYRELRNLRRALREQGDKISGPILVNGLEGYSEKGHKYLTELTEIIEFNRLSKYDVRYIEP